MSPEAERIECSVASSAAGADGPPAGAFRMEHEGRFLAVADAIGIRAQTTGAAHRALQSFFEPLLRMVPESVEALRNAIHTAFDSANAVIATGEETHGIATAPDAVALAALGFFGTEVVIAHVGNVRCYRARAGSIAQLTRDHSAVAELRGGEIGDIAERTFDPFHTHHRNLLTRALGMGTPTPEVSTRSARRGDRFLLCTANVWSEVSEAQLQVALDQARSPEDACRLLRCHIGTRSGYVIVAADVGDRSETTRGGEG